jgi:hypothetical protein
MEDSFWKENEPVLHALDYGANIEIGVSDGVASLTPETRLRPEEDDRSDGEVDTRAGGHEAGTQADGFSGSQAPTGTAQGTPHGSPLNGSSLDDDLELATELDLKYNLDNISSISYAVAVDLHCVDEERSPWCLLADRNAATLSKRSTHPRPGRLA